MQYYLVVYSGQQDFNNGYGSMARQGWTIHTMMREGNLWPVLWQREGK